VVLSVSNLDKLKGIDLNLKALAQVRREYPALDWEYQIIGDGAERKSLERLAKDLAIADRVIFRGRLSHADTLTEIANCDIFSLPSWGENFGIVYLEAMGRGRPVIGCRGWGAAEMVRDGIDGVLVEPRDQVSLQAALAKLLIDPNASKSLGMAAGDRARGFSWGQNVQRYLDLFAMAGSEFQSKNKPSERSQ
jgi:glycosyltransferase involved in cell wall biosynthesis